MSLDSIFFSFVPPHFLRFKKNTYFWTVKLFGRIFIVKFFYFSIFLSSNLMFSTRRSFFSNMQSQLKKFVIKFFMGLFLRQLWAFHCTEHPPKSMKSSFSYFSMSIILTNSIFQRRKKSQRKWKKEKSGEKNWHNTKKEKSIWFSNIFNGYTKWIMAN